MSDALLHLESINTYYQESHVLQGVTLEVAAGTVVGLLGRNGAGKSTTLKSIMGITPVSSGRIVFAGTDLTRLASYRIARQGVAYVPEERGIFPSLTVAEHLTLVPGDANGAWNLSRVYDEFSNLAERRDYHGRQLSGGEQQMLSIARALLLNPRLLILDEPTEGLAPIIVEDIARIISQLKTEGMTMLLVEQNYPFAVGLAEQLYVLGKGRIRWQGSAAALEADADIKHTWIGV